MANTRDLQPLLDVRQNQLGILLGVSDSIDNKALALLAIDVAILLFMAQSNLQLAWWGYLFCLLPYLTSMIINGLAVWPREYRGAAVSIDDHPEYLSMETEQLVLQLIADTQESIEFNKALNTLRLRLCLSGMVATGLATLTLLLILIL